MAKWPILFRNFGANDYKRSFRNFCLENCNFLGNLCQEIQNFLGEIARQNQIVLEISLEKSIFFTRIHNPQISNQIDATVYSYPSRSSMQHSLHSKLQ